MVFGQVISSGRMVEVVPEMRISQAVVGCNVVRMPLLEKLALAVLTRLGAEHDVLGVILACWEFKSK